MGDFLDVLARDAKKAIKSGYYNISVSVPRTPVSLKNAIIQSKTIPIIAEIKLASPSLGVIRKNADVEKIASAMERGGSVGISILTEQRHFKGSLASFVKIRKCIGLPLLMKDIILSPIQLLAAYKIGANAVLLIETLFKRQYCDCNLYTMIAYAHSMGLEVLLETHNEREFSLAHNSETDLIGINNRDLKTMKVDINVSKKILQRIRPKGKIVISESGIENAADIHSLHKYGVDAFLVGTAIMTATNIEEKVQELTHAI